MHVGSSTSTLHKIDTQLCPQTFSASILSSSPSQSTPLLPREHRIVHLPRNLHHIRHNKNTLHAIYRPKLRQISHQGSASYRRDILHSLFLCDKKHNKHNLCLQRMGWLMRKDHHIQHRRNDLHAMICPLLESPHLQWVFCSWHIED